MGQAKADETVQNNPIVDDELSHQIMEENIKQLETEVKLFKDNIEQVNKNIKNFEEQWEIDKEVYDLILSNYKKITPEMEYETKDRYWELKKIQLGYKFRQDSFMAEAKLKEYNSQIKQLEEQLESSNSKLKEMKGE